MKKSSQPIKRHGGKSYLAEKIIALMPSHTRYVEPYFGGGAVMFRKPCEGIAEWANDIEHNLAHFWFVLSDKSLFEEFTRKISCTPFSEPLFDEAKERLRYRAHHGIARLPVDAAVDFFIVNRQSRQALGKDFATPTSRLRRGMNEQVSAWLSSVEGLWEAHERMKRVEIRCGPALDIIKELDGPDTLFYCDPPYRHDTRSSTGEYSHEMTDQDHADMLAKLCLIEGRFMLSGYPSEMYDTAARVGGWHSIDFDLPNNASSKATKERKIERLWMNFVPETVS